MKIPDILPTQSDRSKVRSVQLREISIHRHECRFENVRIIDTTDMREFYDMV